MYVVFYNFLFFVIYILIKENFVRSMEFVGSHQNIIKRYYEKRNIWNTSNLGSILFKNIPQETFSNKSRETKRYVIFTWDISELHQKTRDPLKKCSVKNCMFTTEKIHLETADLVVISTTTPPKLYHNKVKRRKKHQKWVMFTTEYPKRKWRLKYFAGVINWIMTYRIEADIPIPYGRTIPLAKPLMTRKHFDEAPLVKIVPNWLDKKDEVLASTVNNPDTPTGKMYLKELSKYIKIDVCSGSKKKCKKAADYFFYLAFQNVRCTQYITDDIFYHSYQKGAIPVILGTSLENSEVLLPPQSFIHVDQFASIKELAIHMNNVSNNLLALSGYHRWRNHFAVVNEYGLHDTPTCHFCRLCQALNYNDDTSQLYSQDDVNYFFDKNKNCGDDWRNRKSKKKKPSNQQNVASNFVQINRVKKKFKLKQINKGKKQFKKRI